MVHRGCSRRVAVALTTLCALGGLCLPAAARRTGDLVFLHYWSGALSGGVDEMVKAFNRGKPAQKVRASGFEHESFKVGIRVMLDAGNPPDLFSYWAGERTQAVVKAGEAAPIDDVWAQAGLSRVFSPAVQAAATYGGRKYLLPVTQHYVCFFYNRKIFEQQGLRPPRTWEEFRTLCGRLKAAGIAPVALGSRERWPAQFWFDYLLLRTAGPAYRQRLMEGRAHYTDPEVGRAFDLWREVLGEGWLVSRPNLYDWSEAAAMVYHGQAAMTLMGTWAIGYFSGQLGWPEESGFDFFPFPEIDAAAPAAALGPIDGILVARGGDVAAAKKVLSFFAGPEPQERMSRGSGALAPSRQVPAASYSPLRRRILAAAQAPHWAFNYDLATPGPVAEAGLTAFVRFLDSPDHRQEILTDLDRAARQHFAAR